MRRRRVLSVVVLTVLAAAFCAVIARTFLNSWLDAPGVISECQDRFGRYSVTQDDLRPYYRCVDARAELFLRSDFAETKDLSKAFLTLLTAVLVASITFSEKIVDVHRAGWGPRAVMISSWILLLAAIVSCGTGLALMATAAGYAAYFPHLNYRLFEGKAVNLFIAAGLAFGCGLVALLIAGIASMLDRPGSEAAMPVVKAERGAEPPHSPSQESGARPNTALEPPAGASV